MLFEGKLTYFGIFDFIYLPFCLKVGKRDVFHMIKAATGDYKKFIKRSGEDVVVLAHTHRWDLRRYRNYKGNSIIYANTGCWTNNSSEVNI